MFSLYVFAATKIVPPDAVASIACWIVEKSWGTLTMPGVASAGRGSIMIGVKESKDKRMIKTASLFTLLSSYDSGFFEVFIGCRRLLYSDI
jgi:hypothetical protein